jgi:hypothetical protein
MVYKNKIVTLKNREFFVMNNLPCAFVIGLKTIREYDLTSRFKTYFTSKEEQESRSVYSHIQHQKVLRQLKETLTDWDTQPSSYNNMTDPPDPNHFSFEALDILIDTSEPARDRSQQTDVLSQRIFNTSSTLLPVRTVVNKKDF